MNHGVLVRIQNRLADIAEEPEPFRYRALVHAAIFRKRHAFHVLHHEVRRAIRRRVRVIKARDCRMIQLREHALLGGEPRAPRMVAALGESAIEQLVEVYLRERTGAERFLDTYRRVGMAPFKEAVYADAH